MMHRVYIPGAGRFGTALSRFNHGGAASPAYLLVRADSGDLVRVLAADTIPADQAPPHNTGNVVSICARQHRPGATAWSPSPGPSAA